jgi:hypothetical protein
MPEHRLDYHSDPQVSQEALEHFIALTPRELIGFTTFSVLTASLFAFSVLWWALCAARP